jgi:hypothetical protein
MFFFSRGVCFLLICYMLYYSTFVTYPLHVTVVTSLLLHDILVVCTHYFSHIHQFSLFFCSRIPSPPVFSYCSCQHDHCFLHGCPSFALPLNPSLKCIYTPPPFLLHANICCPPFYLLLSLCFACCLLFYLFCGFDQQT